MTVYDPLEIELAALRPREPSAELKRAIANRLAARTPRHAKERRSLWRGSALVGGLLAASLAAVAAWQSGKRIAPEPAASLEVNLATSFDPSLPSFWSYRTAMLQSPESLDVLLDQHADQAFAHKASGAPAFVFARLNSENDSYLGDL